MGRVGARMRRGTSPSTCCSKPVFVRRARTPGTLSALAILMAFIVRYLGSAGLAVMLDMILISKALVGSSTSLGELPMRQTAARSGSAQSDRTTTCWNLEPSGARAATTLMRSSREVFSRRSQRWPTNDSCDFDPPWASSPYEVSAPLDASRYRSSTDPSALQFEG